MFEERGEWPSAGKASQFLHFHQHQNTLTDVYGKNLNYIDLTSDDTDEELEGNSNDGILVENEEEYWRNAVENPTSNDRKDLAWLLKGGPMSTKTKLAHLVVTFKYRGHGTSMADLKHAHQIPSWRPCNNSSVNFLCDCLRQTAEEVGWGRGNPRMICIGHPCFGIITVGQDNIKDWYRIYGCSLGKRCPRGFCVHI